MTNVSFNPKTTPMALVLVGGAVLLSLIYANAFGHMNSVWNVPFMCFAVSAILLGVGLYMWAIRQYNEGKRFGYL